MAETKRYAFNHQYMVGLLLIDVCQAQNSSFSVDHTYYNLRNIRLDTAAF